MASEEVATAEPAAEAPGPKSKLPLIAAIVVGMAIGAGSGVAVVRPMLVKRFTAAQLPAAGDSASAEHGDAGASEGEKGAAGSHDGGKGAAAAPPVVILENLVLNPAGSNGSRYLLMSIAIECRDAKAVEMLAFRDAELKDVILTALGQKSVDELSDIKRRDAIKAELITAIAERFGKLVVKQLYFPQFVIQ